MPSRDRPSLLSCRACIVLLLVPLICCDYVEGFLTSVVRRHPRRNDALTILAASSTWRRTPWAGGSADLRRETLPRSSLAIARSGDSDFVSKRSLSTPVTPKRRRLLTLPRKVGCFYGMLGLAVVLGIRQGHISAVESTAGCGLMWSGFVFAISFTEAWVKFRAPFLPRHFGLDVGRTVFPVLNAVELAFCGTLWAAQFASSSLGLCHSKTFLFLLSASFILLSQVTYLTPKLVLMGKFAIHDALSQKGDPTWTAEQRRLFGDLSSEIRAACRPPMKLHLVYVLGELLKVFSLGAFVRNVYRGSINRY